MDELAGMGLNVTFFGVTSARPGNGLFWVKTASRPGPDLRQQLRARPSRRRTTKRSQPYHLSLASTVLVLVTLVAGFTMSSAQAEDFYWDNNGATAGFGTAGGTWAVPTTGNASQGWSTNSGGTLVPGNVTTTVADDVNFGTTTLALGAGTVTISGSVTNNTVTFATNSPITLSGGTLVLGGAAAAINGSAANTVISSAVLLLASTTVNAPNVPTGTTAAVPFTFNGPISGVADVTFNGVQANNAYGTIVLNAPCNYQGSTLVTTVSSTGGANNTEIFLKLGATNALPTNTVLTLDGGNGTGSGVGRYCELNLNGKSQTVAGLTNVPGRTLRVQRVVNSGATLSTLTVNNSADYTFSGQLGWFLGQNGTASYNNFALAKSGPAMFTLSSSNAYTGHTTISGGTLAVGGAGRLGNGSYAGNITNNAAFKYGSSATQTLSGVISGSGSLTNSGPGVLIITGTNTLPLNIANGGTFSVSGSGSVSGLVSVNSGGTLSFTGGGRANRVTVNPGGTVNLPGSGVATNLTFISTGDLAFDFSTSNTVGSLTVVAANGITNNGVANSVTINITGALPANGTYNLLNYSGSLGGAGFGAYQLGTAPVGKTYTLVDTAGAVQLMVSAAMPSVRVETKPDGTGVVVPANLVLVGTSVTNYAIVRDPFGAFLTNTPATWTLTNITGAVAASNLVAAPDGRSAVFTPTGAGSAQVLAVASGANLVPSGTITSIGLYSRPFIWVRGSEKAGILAKIATNAWASSLSNSLASRVSASLAAYLADPDGFLRTLPVNWAASPPTFIAGTTASFGNLENTFNTALDCAVLYYLSGNTNYARCAADILHNSVRAFQNLAASTSTGNGGWLIPGDLLYEARQVGCQLPVVYDFLYQYLQVNQVYDVDAAGMMNFSFPNAQYVFRTYYQLVRDHGSKNNNWSALMSTCMLNSLLALDSSSERAAALQVYLTTGSTRQASLSYDYRNYSQPGDIWPESLQYASGVGEIRSTHMVLLERYDPSLNLFGVYSNLPTSLPRISYLRYPNTSLQIMFGDGPRSASGHPYFRHELMYQHALARGRTNLTALFGSLINSGVASGGYNRSTLSDYSRLGQHDEPLELLWQAPVITEAAVTPELPRTDTLPFAGIALQRNPAPANNSTYGLMCFLGGAAHTHSHASGMSMELFGLGQVMGSKAGTSTYGTALHENYYRVFAANNTIIVNGASRGEGGWEGVAINTVQTVAMEPQPFAAAVSSNFSFTCSSFADNKGSAAEATQQRTLSIIRTSPTSGFYVDFFRSKSTVSNRVATTLNGSVTNQFHDYIYHNIGSTNINLTTNGFTLPLVSQPSRFQNDIGDTYDQPGWRYFSNTVVSYPHNQPVRAQFNATFSGRTNNYMAMILPAVTNREYARVTAPPIEDFSSANSPALVVRQIGDAWDKPFAVVYEPHLNANGSTVTNVTALWRGNVLVGLKIESVVGGVTRVHYVLSNPNATETYTNPAIGLSFKGRFAIASVDGNGAGSLYLGSGSSLEFNGYLMASVSGANTQAQLEFATGQPPVLTANSPVTVTSPGATLSKLVTSAGVLTPAFSSSLFSYSVTVPFTVANLTVTPTAAFAGATIRVNGNLVASGTPSDPISLNPGTNLISTVVVSPDASTTNTYTITVNRTSDKAWDANGTTAGAGGIPTGTWGVNSYWNSDLAGGAAGSFTSATFDYDNLYLVAAPSATSGTNAYAITVAGAQLANSLNFQSAGAPTLSGGTSITLGDGSDGNGGITVPQYAYGMTAQGNPTLSTPIILNNSQAWFVDAGRTLTINGEISGSGKSLTKSGTGILRLNSMSTYDGNTIVLAGTLALGHASPLPNTAGIFLAAGTTLRPDVTNVFLSSPIILDDSGDTATINAPALNLGGGGGIVSPLILGGPISGDGNVVFNGSASDNTYGTILLNAHGTYAGSTLLNTTATGATLFLKLGINNALPSTTVLTLDGGTGSGSGRITQLDLNGFDQTLAGLTNIPRTLRIQRVVNRSASYAVLTVDNADDYSFSGQLGSTNASTGGVNFGLTKRGPGVFHLTAATAYTGDTTVEGGLLRLAQPTLDSQSSVSIAAGAGLQLDFAGTNRVVALLLAETNQAGGIYNSNNAAPYLTGPGSLEVIPFLPPSPTIESATVSGTNLVLSVPTLLNLNYVLQSATNLSPTINWQSESTNTGTGGPLLMSVPIEPATPQKFLRIWVY